jgi:uncharacterized membrane protein
VPPDTGPTPTQIIGELLSSHPEAESLMGEASHWQALAVTSAGESRRKFAEVQAARRACETLSHRLEPRRARTLHFDLGLALLAAPATGIAVLDFFELSRLPGGTASSLVLALAAAIVWLALAWLAAAARRERRGLAAGIAGAAVLLALLVAAVHAAGPGSGWPPTHAGVLFGAMAAGCILGLTAGAGAIFSRLEPASLLARRRRWHRARSTWEKAERTRQADREAAAVALEAWLGLVRVHVIQLSGGDEQLVKEVTALTAGLLGAGTPELPRAG